MVQRTHDHSEGARPVPRSGESRDVVEFLERSELFQGVPAEMLAGIREQMSEVHFAAGQPVFEGGEKGDAVYLVVEGRLELVSEGVTLLNRVAGECVGEFALIDDEPRSAAAIPTTDVHLLRWERAAFQRTIAEMPIVAQSVFRMLTGKLRQDVVAKVDMRLAQERWEQDLARAREIQLGMLPTSYLRLPTVEIASHLEAAVAVAGDYFDYLELEDGRLAIVIADVTGHGFYSGLFVAMAKSCLHTYARFGYSPVDVMAAFRRAIDLSLGSGLLMACFYAVVDPDAGVLRYASAGHPYPLLYRPATGGLTQLQSEDPILGALDVDDVAFTERSCEWLPGDLLVLYSDGLTESRSVDGTMLGVQAVADCVVDNGARSAERLRESILARMARHTGGAHPVDDVTLVVVRALGDGVPTD